MATLVVPLSDRRFCPLLGMGYKCVSEVNVSTGLRLSDYAATPLYNIKAVVQTTGISPSTLRAWERRYNIARPHRSESGYRLYSERDIALICWLKAQVDAGMSISQAVTWLGKIISEADEPSQAVLPTAGNGITAHEPLNAIPGAHHEPRRELHYESHRDTARDVAHNEVRSLGTLQQELLMALVHFDEQAAEKTITEAFALYSVEQVGDKLFLPVLLHIDERRQRGELSLTMQLFAGNYLVQRLATLLRAISTHHYGPLVWVGSARSEVPEAGAILLSIYLRRAGYRVNYLGQNLPIEEDLVSDLVQEARRHQPAMLLFSATSLKSAERLGQLSTRLTQVGHLPAIIGYSGAVYMHNPELRAATSGVYIGANAQEVVQNINELLAARHGNNTKGTSTKGISTKDDKKHDQKLHNGSPLVAKPWQIPGR